MSYLKTICNPKDGDIEVRKRGKQEFYDFVQRTFNKLYEIENHRISGESSIGLFCRMDIGIIINKDSKVSYAVNEVERTTTCSLWCNDGSMHLGTFGMTLAR